MFFMTLVFSKIADSAFGFSEKGALGLTHQINSHLYVTTITEDDQIKVVDVKDLKTDQYEVRSLQDANIEDPEVYKAAVKYYYLNYKTGNVDSSSLPSGANIDEYVLPGHEKKINVDGVEILPADYYKEEWFNAKIQAFSSDKSELQNYQDLASEAMTDLGKTEFFQTLKKDLNKSQIFVMTLSFLCSYSIVFFTIPVCFKNGQTIGKKILNLSFVTKDGYDIKRRQIVFRQLILFVYVSLAAFIIGVELITTAVTLMFGVGIYFVAVALSKPNRSFADYLSYTYLIDSKNSVWFHDEEQEKEKEGEIEQNIKKLHKYTPKNKNIIQVGSKVVTEDTKKKQAKKQK